MIPCLWTLVLAAGQGRRLSGITSGVPKQFWRPPGAVSFLESTLARFAPFAPPARTIVVVDHSHWPYVSPLTMAPGSKVLYQPSNRGTAAGLLFGLLPIVDANPDAIVLMTPADQGVHDVASFHAGLIEGVTAIRQGRASIVLFGVEPDSPHADYGWIAPASNVAPARHPVQPIAAFVEKPPAAEALALRARGAVWNTMVLVASVRALVQLHVTHVPELARVFAGARARAGAGRIEYLERAYAALPAFDFSRDVLMRGGDLSLATWPASLGWSDLGTPDRLDAWRASEQSWRAPGAAPAAVRSLA